MNILLNYQVKRAEDYLQKYKASFHYVAYKVYGKYPPTPYFANRPEYWTKENWNWFLSYRNKHKFND